MICSNCGNNQDSNNKFCRNCGNKLEVNNTNNMYNNQNSYPHSVNNYNQSMYNNQGINYGIQNEVVTSSNIVHPNNSYHQNSNYIPNRSFTPVNGVNNNYNQNSSYSMHNIGLTPVNNNYNQNMFNKVPSNLVKKNNNALYTCLGIISVTLILVVTLIIVYSEDSVYFSKDNEEDYISYRESSKSTPGKTVIDPDRVYYMTVKDNTTAYNKIKEDSVSQKSTCPKEIIEIENRIINNYNITAVNLCEMDLDYAKEIEEVIKRIYVEYPKARGYLTNFTLVNASDSEGYIAAFRSFYNFIIPDNSAYPIVSKNSILLNTKYFLNSSYMISSISAASNRGHFPKNTTRTSPVAHEFGHYLSFISAMKKYNINSILIIDEKNMSSIYDLILDWNEGKNSLDIINTAYKNYQKNYNDNKTSLLEFRSSISAYAVAKNEAGNYLYDETIAEAFHDYYLNGNNAKPASKEIVAELKRRIS